MKLPTGTGLNSLLEKDSGLEGGPLDRSNPRSLINIAPREIVEILEREMPLQYLYMSELELIKAFNPSADLQKVRIAFWKEYEMAQSDIRKMLMANIGHQLGQNSVYVSRVLRDPQKLAVVLCPVTSYDNFLEESLMAGSRKLREIIEMPLLNPDGTPDHKTMEIVLKAVAFLDMRKHGGIVQKQLQVNMTKSSQKSLIGSASMEEIDAKIRELESKSSLQLAREIVGPQRPAVIEVEATDKVINELEAEFSGRRTGD